MKEYKKAKIADSANVVKETATLGMSPSERRLPSYFLLRCVRKVIQK
jgi:hypothetical protein